MLSLSFHPVSAGADERILNFQSDITVHQDALMIVKETMRVRSEGDKIKRGIYSDFSTRYRDRFENRYVVGFTVLAVLRDGHPEPYNTERISNSERVYIGQKEVFLDPGEYTYPLEVLTVVVSWEKGFVAGPAPMKKFGISCQIIERCS